jgi:5-methylcytosine-specific restriction endonuclease McrA
MPNFYASAAWRELRARAIERDHGACTVRRLGAGPCSPGPLHVHHIDGIADGGDPLDLANCITVCARHHGVWEALHRRLADAA